MIFCQQLSCILTARNTTDRIRQRAQKKDRFSAVFSVGVDGLATAQINLLRLTPFRSAHRGAPTRTSLRNELLHNLFYFYTPTSASKLAPECIKTKKMSFDIFLLRLFLWELTDSNRRPSACKADALNQLS